MAEITNDNQFKQELSRLSFAAQRQVGVQFIENVSSLAGDDRLRQVLQIASNGSASDDELAMALRIARSVSLERHTRCGADADWNEQAGYFVARAAESLVATTSGKRAEPAWQAAMNSRMARNCALLAEDSSDDHQEDEAQYRIVSDYIDKSPA